LSGSQIFDHRAAEITEREGREIGGSLCTAVHAVYNATCGSHRLPQNLRVFSGAFIVDGTVLGSLRWLCDLCGSVVKNLGALPSLHNVSL
jgi:hypothetical protein